MAGAQQPEHKLDGVSLRPLLQGQSKQTRDALVMHVPAYNGSEGRKNIIDPFFQTPCTVVWRENYKYVRNYEPDREDELFDLDADIGEQNNLAKSHPEILSEMSKQMDKWVKDNQAALPQPLETSMIR
ncbi:MAG: sulfatase/phosphatase domain-containing protein [Verrucomicrobiota bacterium]